MHMEKIYLVVDGSQSAPNIRHSLLSQGFPNDSIIEVEQSNPSLYEMIQSDVDAGICKGVIVSGSPRSVTDADATHLDKRIYDLPVKKLLICYAYQDAAYQLGGAVRAADNRENGVETLTFADDIVFAPFSKSFIESLDGRTADVVTNHGDEVVALWPGVSAIVASTPNNALAVVYDNRRNIIAVQPHFEISNEKVRAAFFQNFRKWTDFKAFEEFTPAAMEKYIDEELRKNAPLGPGKKAMIALSGGVDSTTLAAAAIRHYGRENVVLTFVDTGLLRRDYPKTESDDFGFETDRLLKLMRKQFGKVIKIDAKKRFIKAIAKADGFDNPETNNGRRQIIGNLFADIFADYADERGDIQYFFQGTNQADRQESGKGAGKSGRIKTHHNEVPYLRERLEKSGIQIVEPLTWLYKNNIIALGQYLGLDMDLYKQPPFPGPGLAVRIDGNVTHDTLDFVGICDAIVRKHIETAIASGEIKPLAPGMQTRQYFAALLNTADNNAHSVNHIDAARPREFSATYRADCQKYAAFEAIHDKTVEKFSPWVNTFRKECGISEYHIALLTTTTTTGQKGDGRVDGYQAEVRLFGRDGRPSDISCALREQLANELMNIREITRVSYALNRVDAGKELRDASGKLVKIEINSVDTRDFTSFNATDIPTHVLMKMVDDITRRLGPNILITAAFGGKPGRTTERH